MRGKKMRTALCLLLVGTVLAAFVALAADAGSQADPLVTLSYLNDTFLGQILEKVDGKLSERNETLKRELTEEIRRREQELLHQGGVVSPAPGPAAAAFTAVELSGGQTLWGSAGCEVMLRQGKATCVSPEKSTPGLMDATTGSSINHGTALTADHLYLMTADRGIKAGDAVTLLVRGTYTIG